MKNDDAVFAAIGLLPLIIIFVAWLVCGAVASGIGPDRYSGRLFILTFLFLGPLGVAVALIMKAIEDYAPRQLALLPLQTSAQQNLRVGDRVTVTDPVDDYHGQIGVVDEITDETDGYNIYVAFGNDPETYAFSRMQLSPLRTRTT